MKTEFTPEEQKANLLKLAAGLRNSRKRRDFSMESYAENSQHGIIRQPYKVQECGSVCCAVGHGPILVAPALEEDLVLAPTE